MMKSVLTRLGNTRRKYGKFREAEGASKMERKALEKQHKAVKKIETRLKNVMPGVRRVALMDIIAKDLAIHNKAKAFEFLAIGMEDSDAEIRKMAVQLLGKVVAIGYDQQVESDACGPCGLESTDVNARVAAIRAMGRLVCPSDVQALEMVAQHLTDREAVVRECCAQVLCKVTTRAYVKASEIIACGIRSPDAEVRRDCLNLLAIISSRNNERHLTAIARAARDEDAAVRLAAESAKFKVEQRGNETALELFVEHSLEHADAAVRRNGIAVIHKNATGKDEALHFFTNRSCAPPAGSRGRASSCGGGASRSRCDEPLEKLPWPSRSASCEPRDGREGSGRPMRNMCHGGA